jgi:hypothetical protein
VEEIVPRVSEIVTPEQYERLPKYVQAELRRLWIGNNRLREENERMHNVIKMGRGDIGPGDIGPFD